MCICSRKGLAGMRVATKLVLCGSGASAPTPSMRCILGSHPCPQCVDASGNIHSKNRRGNSSLFIQASPRHEALTATSDSCNLLVDCGKTFRDAVLRHVAANHVKKIDALILTHHHADAILGLDDVRELLPPMTSADIQTLNDGGKITPRTLPTFCDAHTEETIRRTFPYLFPDPCERTTRWIGGIEFHGIKHRQTADVMGLAITPFSLNHGDCTCFGFVIPTATSPQSVALYMSDVASLSTEELQWIRGQGEIDVAFIDCLSQRSGRNPAHFHASDAVDAAIAIGAKRTVFIGMGHTIDYTKFSNHLRLVQADRCTHGKQLECGFDGWAATF